MHELLPVFLGAIFGIVAAGAPVPGPRSAWFVGGCAIAGALASLVNGELTTSLAGLFIGLDAALAWCGGTAALLAVRFSRRSAVG
jgi:hypothetical protein